MHTKQIKLSSPPAFSSSAVQTKLLTSLQRQRFECQRGIGNSGGRVH